MFTQPELNDLANRLARDCAQLLDIEPLAPQASCVGDALTFSFHGGLKPEEELLALAEDPLVLREAREELLEPVGSTLIRPVEEFADCPVSFHLGLFDPPSSASMILFAFDRIDPPAAGSDPRHLFLRSEAVRMQARRLRQEAVSARDTHLRIREEFRQEQERFRHRHGA